MNKQILDEQLQQLGLSEDEAMLYLFLLENGPKTPLEISRESSLNRSKIYRLTEALQAKHLIEESKTAWGQKLKAASPENLQLLITYEKEQLRNKEAAIPDLIQTLSSLSIHSQSTFEIKHYKGTEGLKQMVWNELTSQETLIFGHLFLEDYVGFQFAEKVRQEEVLRKIKVYEINNDDSDFDTKVAGFKDKVFSERNISPDILSIQQQITIYNNTLAVLNNLNDELIGIEIINKQFAETQRQIFWHYWELGH